MDLPKNIDYSKADSAFPDQSKDALAKAYADAEINKANTVAQHGPERPQALDIVDYRGFSQKRYLEGHAHKIVRDLTLVARLYNGHLARFFVIDESERCPSCTNQVTGERVLSRCPVCHGTGYTKNWKKIGDYWTLMDFGPAYNMAQQTGNSENPGGVKTGMMILGAPMLPDQTVAIFTETKEAWKLYDVLPHLVAMRGEVLIQIAQLTRLTPGAEEYKLVNW